MKKFMSFLIVVTLLLGSICAIAETDYSGMTLDELLKAQEQLNAAIEAAQQSTDNQATQEEQAPILDVSNYTEMSKGAKGDEVKTLQARLKELGFYASTIDGDYGNGTVNAIKAFEDYNGLEQTGIASPELQAFLYSEDAKGIEIPDIEITSLGMRKSYGTNYARPTFVNHTDYTVDGITCLVKGYNSYGERIIYDKLTVNDVRRHSDSDDYQLEYSTFEISNIKIKAGGKYQLVYSNEMYLGSFDSKALTTVYMAVSRYHTDDGSYVEIPENEQIWYGSDGKVVTVEYENNQKEIAELTNEIEEKSDNVDLGLHSEYYISNFFSEVAGIPMGGLYIDGYNTESPIADAGLKNGDIIVKIGDVWVYDEDTFALAKGLMDDAGTTTLIYYRKGEQRETEIKTF